jgi:hypothetical protein
MCTSLIKSNREECNRNNQKSINRNIPKILVMQPADHISEFLELHQYEIYQRVEQKMDLIFARTELYRLADNCIIKQNFAEETTRRILDAELQKGKKFSKSEINSKINAHIRVRIPSWFERLLKQDLGSYFDSVNFLIEKNDQGKSVDWGKSLTDEWSFSEDRFNAFNHTPFEVFNYKDEMKLVDRALERMAKQSTKNSHIHYLIVAIILDRTDLVSSSDIDELHRHNREYMITLTFHACRKLARIVGELCPATRKKQLEQSKGKTSRKIKKSIFRDLKEDNRKKTPLYNSNEKHGEVIIVYQRHPNEQSGIVQINNSR